MITDTPTDPMSDAWNIGVVEAMAGTALPEALHNATLQELMQNVNPRAILGQFIGGWDVATAMMVKEKPNRDSK